MSKLYAFTILVFLLTTGAALAQAEGAPEGVAANGLCGLSSVAYPVCRERLNLSASSAYGFTESMGPVAGSHHRLSGKLGVGYVPLPWVALALRMDGRLDLHPRDQRGKNLTGTGDPRLFVRAGRELGAGLSLGGEAVLWFPGTDAPSFEPSATTVDLKALLAFRSAALPLALLANVGMRIDQSAASAPDLARVRPGDRIALGLSDSHAVLLALGAASRVHPRAELFGELALDLLVGSAAPSFASSPMRAVVGGRAFVSDALSVELKTTVSFQQRPSTELGEPLVPIEPRAQVGVGIRYAFDLRPPPPPPPVEKPREVEPPEPQTATVTGVLLDDQGAPLPDAEVVLRAGELERETITDGEGRYTFTDVPVGPATLESRATGFETLRWELTVGGQMRPLEPRPLTAKGNVGTLRVLTRSFESEPIAATVEVHAANGKKVLVSGSTDAEGRYESDLPPGEYVVMISAPGYRPHRREIRIERYGVAIMNVDLHAEK